MPEAKLVVAQVAVDCAHAEQLASFYADVLERPVDAGASEYHATIGRDGHDPMPAPLMFLRVPEPRLGKNRLHIDLVSTQWRDHVERALAAGATRVGDFDEYGTTWTTLADPEGNLFDIGAAH